MLKEVIFTATKNMSHCGTNLDHAYKEQLRIGMF